MDWVLQLGSYWYECWVNHYDQGVLPSKTAAAGDGEKHTALEQPVQSMNYYPMHNFRYLKLSRSEYQSGWHMWQHDA